MKTYYTNKFVWAVLGLAALVFSAPAAHAQTTPVTATVVVDSTMSVLVVDNMNFGTIAAVGDATNLATLAIDPLTDALTPTNNAPAVIFVVDDTLARAASLTVGDVAEGATINVTIDNIVDPTDGTTAFDLGTLQVSWNGAAATPQAEGVSFAVVDVAGGAPNTIDIGATLSTVAGGTYADATYAGGFDLIVAY
jgi:hypothetical protein